MGFNNRLASTGVATVCSKFRRIPGLIGEDPFDCRFGVLERVEDAIHPPFTTTLFNGIAAFGFRSFLVTGFEQMPDIRRRVA